MDKKLLELVKIRVSQQNGCAYCLDMHTHETRQEGESQQRIYCLPAWREAPLYSDAERAALELAEAVTLLPTHRVSDELFGRLRVHWDEKGICDLVKFLHARGLRLFGVMAARYNELKPCGKQDILVPKANKIGC